MYRPSASAGARARRRGDARVARRGAARAGRAGVARPRARCAGRAHRPATEREEAGVRVYRDGGGHADPRASQAGRAGTCRRVRAGRRARGARGTSGAHDAAGAHGAQGHDDAHARRRSPRRASCSAAAWAGSAGSESFGWSISVPARHAAAAVELLADVVQHPTIPDDALETERTIALADLAALRDDMYRYPVRLATRRRVRRTSVRRADVGRRGHAARDHGGAGSRVASRAGCSMRPR